MYQIGAKYTADFLRGMALDDLRLLEQDARHKLLEIRTNAQSAGVREPHWFGKVKTDIARFLTMQREGI